MIRIRMPVPASVLLSSLATAALLVTGCAGDDEKQGARETTLASATPLRSAPDANCAVATHGGHEYWFCSQARNFAMARQRCEAAGLKLARSDSQLENEFLLQNLLADAWVGADDIAAEGTFKWHDNGDTFWAGGAAVQNRFTKWGIIEPDNFFNQDCVTVSDLDGYWADRGCGESHHYICEAPLVAADPGVTCADSGPPGSPWPSFKRCASQQSRSATLGAQTASPVTTFATTGDIESSPAVAADGTVYVGSNDGGLYAIRPDGTQRWRFSTGGPVRSAPALAADGTIYFGSDDNGAYAVNPDGTQRWRYATGGDVRAGARVAADGTIYIGSDDSKFYALNPNGTRKWHYSTGLWVRSTAAIGPDGTVYIASDDSKLYALNPNGAKKWHFEALAPIKSSPAIGPDGTIYVGSADAHVRGLSPGSGEEIFTYFGLGPVISSPAIAPDGSVVVGDHFGKVRSFTPDLQLRWEFPAGAAIWASPVIGADGTVYVGAETGRMHALDGATGAERWSVLTGGVIGSSAAIGANGTLYVGSNDDKLYAIGGGPAPQVSCVSQVGIGRFAALFGYDNRLPIAVTLAHGPANTLSPAPADPIVKPVTTFQPGLQRVGFWAPFAAGSTVSWSLQGRTVTASTSSTPCTIEAYPQPASPPPAPGSLGSPEGPSPTSPNLPKLAAYFSPSSHVGSAFLPVGMTLGQGSTTMVNNIAVTQQALSFSRPFKVKLTRLNHGGDQGFGDAFKPHVDVEVDGVYLGQRNVGPCSGGGWGGCIIPPFILLDEEFVINVPTDKPTVHVRIRGIEKDDPGEDDKEVTIHLDVDNRTGQWSGTTNFPTNCQTESNGWGVCWEITPAGKPSMSSPTLCSSWNADFVDDKLGEDHIGTPAPVGIHDEHPASFAEFVLDVRGPNGNLHVGAFYQNDVLVPGSPPKAFLDQDGCIPVGVIPAEFLMFLPGGVPGMPSGVEIDFQQRSAFERGGIRYSVKNVTVDGLGNRTPSTHLTLRARASTNDISLAGYTEVGGFMVPPAVLRVRTQVIREETEVSAVISRMLTLNDSGIPDGDYLATVNDGCLIDGQLNSCFSDNRLMVGPASKPLNAVTCVVDSTCPGIQTCQQDSSGALFCHWPPQTRWKYITAHEAGHQIQERAMGRLNNNYTFTCPNGSCPGRTYRGGLIDPPFADSLCACSHVEAANAAHCLQSIEAGGAAHSEGYAQFFASKVWNRQDQADCTFVYYKEVLLAPGAVCPTSGPQDCKPFNTTEHGVLQAQLPPVAFSCAKPFQRPGGSEAGWRNSFCPISNAAELATELDVMGFLWNINTTTPDKVTTMSDLFLLYRRACNPTQTSVELCNGQAAAWEPREGVAGIRQGAELFYGMNSPKYLHIVEQARRFGVTPQLTP